MKLPFVKMHGCGNDYIYFDCFTNPVPDPEQLSIRLSDHHFGIGGDGIILICPSEVADAKMRMFNADGSEGKMCGNGIRCVGKYLYDTGKKKKQLSIETLSGIKHLALFPDDQTDLVQTVRVDMGPAQLRPSDIPAYLDGSRIVGVPLVVDERVYHITCVSMGNPHCVIFMKEDVALLDLPLLGPKFENNALFPERINTEFVNVLGDGELKMRVWERGSGETLACGTGACAAGVAACLRGYCEKGQDIRIHLRGGDLTIHYTDETVFMTGSATKVFEGVIEI